jgi:hypothetical protein
VRSRDPREARSLLVDFGRFRPLNEGEYNMDPLVTPIVIILGKYALDRGLELGKEVGPQALETAKEMFALALDHLRKKPAGQVIAGEFEQDPETYEKPVEKELDTALQANPGLAQQLQDLLARYEQERKEYAAAQGLAYTVTQTRDGAIAQGDGATAMGAGATQIQVGGSVAGGLTTGGGRPDERP